MVYFIVFFGSRARTSVVGSGRFHCPQCGGEERTYDHKRVRRWFTLYFIPLIPMNVVGEFIHCRACDGTFKHEVLAWRPKLPEPQPADKPAAG